jgi:hypothetical protein
MLGDLRTVAERGALFIVRHSKHDHKGGKLFDGIIFY